MAIFPVFFFPEQAPRILLEYLGQDRVIPERQITRHRFNDHLASHRQGRPLERPVHLMGSVENGICGLGTHVGLHRDLGWNDIHQVTTLGNDRVDPDTIRVGEGLPLGIDSAQRKLRRVEGVDPPLW